MIICDLNHSTLLKKWIHKFWRSPVESCNKNYHISIELCQAALGALFILMNSTCATVAQIIPDATLPNRTLVEHEGNTNLINGGARAGGNLFHSFEQFSVPTGNTVFFTNPVDIQNIITRVTGSHISNIDGILKANGTANLYLLNPNGIIFGSNAKLNIGGSFLSTTASNITFTDGTVFSASKTLSPALLTVSVPIGLGFGSNPGTISVQGQGNNLSGKTFQDRLFISPVRSNDTGLQVSPGKSIALIGGNITLAGGILTAPGGTIELGSISDGVVSINPTTSGWNFGYQGVHSFQDINLSQALVNASGVTSGTINLHGQLVSLKNSSVLLIQDLGLQPSGGIYVNASKLLEVSGATNSQAVASSLATQTLIGGQGGDIVILTPDLILRQGGTIETTTVSAGNGGNITINGSESVQLINTLPVVNARGNFISAYSYGVGKAGNVTISTARLTMMNGGIISSNSGATGNSGNVTINASDTIELMGFIPSYLTLNLTNTINFIGADTIYGNGGAVNINTSKLILRDGGRVDASTFASGNAGSVIINATDSVDVSGKAPGFINPTQVLSAANILDLVNRQFLGLPPVPSGASGNVEINTPRLSVTDGAQVTVQNQGSGNAGTLKIKSSSVFLDNQGSLTAATASGVGGNIILHAENLQARRSSSISATAETLGLSNGNRDGNGGNLNIDANTLVALESSNIQANAVRGRGGNIKISSQGLFISPDSVVSASSQLGVNGVVSIQEFSIDVKNTLTSLRVNFVSPEQVVAGSCIARRNQQGSFVVTGSGGLPSNPYGVISGEYQATGIQSTRGKPTAVNSQPLAATSWKIGDRIVEAQSMVVLGDGRVLLTANSPTPSIPDASAKVCHISG